MRVLIVSGIWPPDVGGPASHAPEVAAFLRSRGHRVEAVVTADAPPAEQPYPVAWVPRSLPPGVRHARSVQLIAARARRADVVYTTGMFGRSSAAAAIARRPLVVKLTADPAYERAKRWRLFDGSLADFQERPPAATLPLRLLRDADVAHAAHLVFPSAYLRELALGWGIDPAQASLLPNPTPPLPELPPREQLRGRYGFTGTTLVFAGRLTTQKALEVALEAVGRVDGVELVIAGDGPDRAKLEAIGGARFLGPQSRQQVLELFRAADAGLLSSSWENFPHVVVEALAVGTPFITTRAGGVAEVVTDGENGLIVEPNDPAALAAAIERFAGDAALRERLRAAAAPSVAAFAPEHVYGRLEQILLEAAR
jgi:glycosyltransferase involved in cell wall biosynthesis